MSIPEIINIGEPMQNDPITLSSDDRPLKSTNFGPGIELLMNDKKSSTSKSSDIDIEDLSNLEAELNEFSKNVDDNNVKIELNELPNEILTEEPLKVNFEEIKLDRGDNNTSKIGESTAETINEDKTWDGYGKFNNIPLNPDYTPNDKPKLSGEDMMREKFKYVKKLEMLERKGVELTKKYTMESSLQEMMGEYEMIMSEKEKDNSVKFQGNMLSAVINGIEFLNNRFDPFDVKLDGWSDQFSENINDYDDIFGELHEKYKSKAKMAPELKLMFQLAGSAMMVHMTNTMFKSSMPNMDDIMRQNPELAQQFTQAAVNSMGTTNPGVAGFMNNVMNPQPKPVSRGPPPPPIKTQGPNAVVPPKRQGFVENKPSFSSRPDIEASKSIDLDDNYGNPNETLKSSRQRPEMKGPTDVSNLLSGLKTKSINIQQSNNNNDDDDKGSTISLSELKELQKEDSLNGPKRTKRKQKSDRNTISLDI